MDGSAEVDWLDAEIDAVVAVARERLRASREQVDKCISQGGRTEHLVGAVVELDRLQTLVEAIAAQHLSAVGERRMPQTVEQLHARQVAGLAGLRRILADYPRPLSTAGELAYLLARLPAELPLTVSNEALIDHDVDRTTWQRCARVGVAVAADTTVTAASTRTAGIYDHIGAYDDAAPTLTLSGVPLAEDGTEASLPDRVSSKIIEVMPNGDDVMAACAEAILIVADRLVDSGCYRSPRDRVSDAGLLRELELEADRLRHCAARLAALRGRIVADLATEQDVERSNTNGEG